MIAKQSAAMPGEYVFSAAEEAVCGIEEAHVELLLAGIFSELISP
jgi:hypothetical protein